jgi:Lon protease-like protein
LGTVLLPGVVLPLHVFKARYQQLVRDIQSDRARVRVVLIDRGSESAVRRAS